MASKMRGYILFFLGFGLFPGLLLAWIVDAQFDYPEETGECGAGVDSVQDCVETFGLGVV
jgi:hypothetical protein